MEDDLSDRMDFTSLVRGCQPFTDGCDHGVRWAMANDFRLVIRRTRWNLHLVVVVLSSELLVEIFLE